MAPTHHSRASSIAPGAARHKGQLQQKKPAYKVVLEQVTEKKKKLLTLVCLYAEVEAEWLTDTRYLPHSSLSTPRHPQDIRSFRQATLN